MKEVSRLNGLIEKNQKFLAKYELQLSADPNDFGAKLMVANISKHISDLRSQLEELNAVTTTAPSVEMGRMSASSAF